MYHHDPISAGQLHHANVLTAQQRTRGTPVSNRVPRWRAPYANYFARRRAIPLLVDHELFIGLDRKELARAGELFEVVKVKSGQSLGEQGMKVTGFVTILEGRVGVTIDGVPHAVLDDGSHLGALSLIDDERPTHRASFSVMAPSRIGVVAAARFPELLEGFPVVADRIRAIVAVRRAYLAGLAAGAAGDTQTTPSRAVTEYPVHLTDAGSALRRREVMQVRGRTSR
ncbi:cyclic nucleotide-binding domain-containing protein [Ilumatobacter sp.]|uniref:cyclic nucleotide-binding domain-containing protein n=1 Tax=Ilumatobacter sp. TaxID=1967498 RepID=UPI003C624AE4